MPFLKQSKFSILLVTKIKSDSSMFHLRRCVMLRVIIALILSVTLAFGNMFYPSIIESNGERRTIAKELIRPSDLIKVSFANDEFIVMTYGGVERTLYLIEKDKTRSGDIVNIYGDKDFKIAYNYSDRLIIKGGGYTSYYKKY